MTLSELGFDQWFEEHAPTSGPEGCAVARVAAVDRGAYRIRDASGEAVAGLSGRLAHRTESPAGLPCVGDWVTALRHAEGSRAVIHQVFPRKTFLRRRAAGEAGEVQMAAANVDTAFIVQSCLGDFNPNRLDRYRVMAAEGGVEAVVLLTKADLAPPEELERKLAIAGAAGGCRAMALSNRTGSGLDAFRQALAPGRTYCLLGSSGVGKTSLLNRLLGREAFETKEVSGTGEGVHTTTRRQLVVLGGGALMIDTPGMRELGLLDVGEGLDDGFADVAALSRQCRYADCRHENEPGCAVREALERGELPQARFASYGKLRKETEHHAMSSLDRRRKDKAFGRFLHSFKKGMKH